MVDSTRTALETASSGDLWNCREWRLTWQPHNDESAPVEHLELTAPDYLQLLLQPCSGAHCVYLKWKGVAESRLMKPSCRPRRHRRMASLTTRARAERNTTRKWKRYKQNQWSTHKKKTESRAARPPERASYKQVAVLKQYSWISFSSARR